MKLALPGRKKIEDSSPDPRKETTTPAKSRVNHLGARLGVIGFYTGAALCLGMSGTALVAAAAVNTTPVAAVTAPDTSPAESTAVSYVTAWLTATQDNQSLLEPYMDGRPVYQLPAVPMVVRDVSVAGVQVTKDPSVVSVLVSAHVEQPQGGDEEKKAAGSLSERLNAQASQTKSSPQSATSTTPPELQLRYYQVAVRTTGGAVQVIGFPTPAAGPEKGGEVALAYPQRLTLDSGLGKTMDGFLQAAYAGKGDVTRYTAPGVGLRPVEPAPYKAMHITDVRTDQALEDVPAGTPVRVLIQAEAELPDARGSRQGVTVPVTVTNRENRWEVTSLDPAPAIAPATTDTPASTTPTS